MAKKKKKKASKKAYRPADASDVLRRTCYVRESDWQRAAVIGERGDRGYGRMRRVGRSEVLGMAITLGLDAMEREGF